MSAPADELIQIARRLARAVQPLRFGAPVAHVCNPLDYAFALHRQFLERYARGRVQAVLLGMNPGPWGMMQTGIPFGEVAAVREWMQLDAPIRRPRDAHPKRPILGLECGRSEVSGRRVWAWAQRRFGSPAEFFRRFFVLNYCPLAFLSSSGSNITPDKLAPGDRAALLEVCDGALRDALAALGPDQVVGIGGFAAQRARAALVGTPYATRVSQALHPSPASPAANRGWEAAFERDLALAGIALA